MKKENGETCKRGNGEVLYKRMVQSVFDIKRERQGDAERGHLITMPSWRRGKFPPMLIIGCCS